MDRSKNRVGMVVASTLALVYGTAIAGSHLWKINEVFSNADGTVQFIELFECCGSSGEVYMKGLELTSDAAESVFTFPEDLVGDTSNRYLLLATKSFASLPGAPTPDYIIPEGFFSPFGDTLRYSPAETTTGLSSNRKTCRPTAPTRCT